MEYKKIYDPQELAELVEWCKANIDKVPASLQLNEAYYIEDLPRTINIYIDIIHKLSENATYGAQIRHLFVIREKLINDHLLKEE